MSEVIKIANCSGFYGDNLSIAKKMVEGGPIDVLTGDYLAELTMTILYNQKMKRGENLGYVGTFLKQFRDVAKLCNDQNIKIVSNAGGLNPASMAAEVENIIKELNRNEAGNIELEIPLINSKKNKNDLIFFILLTTYLFIFFIYKKKNEKK